jgi:solute carrier family 35, member F1/2
MSPVKQTHVVAMSVDKDPDKYVGLSSSNEVSSTHGSPEVVGADASPEREPSVDEKKQTWTDKLAFFKTMDFWIILALGQILAICITGTNTLTTLLVIEGTSIPAFQTLFNYVLLNFMYTGYTLYRYGFKKWGQVILKDGWKCKCRV